MKWKYRVKWGLFCFLISFCFTTFAANIDNQRKNFRYASEAINKGNLTEYYRLKPLLKDYSLYPYLQFAEINRMMNNSLPTAYVETFLKTYPKSALAERMRVNWLNTLAKQQQWALYQQFYTPSNDVSLQCYAIWAEYKANPTPTILNKAAPLWIVPRSQPTACNTLFNAWQKSSGFSSAQAWQRSQLAMAEKQATLVTYLKRYLPPNQQALSDLWLSVHHNPALIKANNLGTNKDPFVQTIQVYGMKRLISQDPVQAETTWASIKDRYPFTANQNAEIDYAFAINLATQHHLDAIKWLNAVPAAKADDAIYEWRVRYYLRQQQWPQVHKTIATMPESLRQLPLWRYWAGRSLMAQNQTGAAEAILKPLAKERNYHGMLASDLLKLPYTLNDIPYAPTPAVVASVNRDGSVIRARELLAIGRIIDARREWNAAINHFDEEQLQAAAKLASSMQWYDRAIITAGKAKNRDDLTVRFPTAYASDMKKSAQKNNISPAWAFSITRQESAFLTDAQSSAGALGLMQLLPSTAQQVAKQAGLVYSKDILIVPAKNIALGTTYLRDMATKFNKNTLLASAAYNAGATRVYRWLPDAPMPTDIWVETIPFKETRNYVQNVFSFQVIYQDRLGMNMERLDHHVKMINP